jgi:preprotein translocase subunit SecG
LYINLLVAIGLLFVGCGGDVHEVTPGSGNSVLQKSMGVVAVKTSEKVLFPKAKKLETKSKEANKTVALKTEVIESKIAEEKSTPLSAKSVNVKEALASLSAANNTPERKRKDDTAFTNQYILAQEQIQKDLKIVELESTSRLAIAQVESDKMKLLKEKELEATLETSKLEHDLKSKEIATDLEKSKISKVIKEQELSNKLEQIKLQNELSIEEQKNEALISHEKMGLYKIIMMVAAALILITLFMVYFISKRNREMKLQLQEKEILKEREMQVLEHQNQRVNKMLEIVSSQNLSENVEKELLDSIKDANKTIWMFEDGKGSKKGLIFKS